MPDAGIPVGRTRPAACEQAVAEWRKELVPGVAAPRALSYLLANGFDCQVTRDEQSQVERIIATPPAVSRVAAGIEKDQQIDLAIREDVIQTVRLTPLSFR